jgi:hypothetical protein
MHSPWMIGAPAFLAVLLAAPATPIAAQEPALRPPVGWHEFFDSAAMGKPRLKAPSVATCSNVDGRRLILAGGLPSVDPIGEVLVLNRAVADPALGYGRPTALYMPPKPDTVEVEAVAVACRGVNELPDLIVRRGYVYVRLFGPAAFGLADFVRTARPDGTDWQHPVLQQIAWSPGAQLGWPPSDLIGTREAAALARERAAREQAAADSAAQATAHAAALAREHVADSTAAARAAAARVRGRVKAREDGIRARWPAAIADRIIQRKAWIGMTVEMLQDSWGAPRSRNRTMTASRTNEQWVYGDFCKPCVYLQDGVVTSIQD